jgi:hypothetical protein
MPLKLLWLMPLAWAPMAVPQSDGLPAKETLHYNIEWRLITAGKATLDWSSLPQSRAGWQVNLHVESVGLVSKLFKVEDDYTAVLNQSLCLQSAHGNIHEGSRLRETRLTIGSEGRRAAYLERDRAKNVNVLAHEIDVPPCVHDLAGGLHFLRTVPIEAGQSVQLPVTDGKKSVTVKVEAQQAEDVKTPAGTFRATRYEIHLFNGMLYNRPAHLYIWLTDDRRKLPVQIRVRMTVAIGTITLQLAKREGS